MLYLLVLRMKRRAPQKRRNVMISFDPSGPVREMLEAQVRAEESRGNRRSRSRIIERCIADQLRKFHPELAHRYEIISAERWHEPLLIERKQAA
jgi:hypothetical protein